MMTVNGADDETRRRYVVEPLTGPPPEIGRWLWALNDTRRRTLAATEGIEPQALDWTGRRGRNSIGTLLTHIAVIEFDWLFAEVLERDPSPDEWGTLPRVVRDPQGHLSVVTGLDLPSHLQQLAAVRSLTLAVYQAMDLVDFRSPRHLPDYDVTPEWVLHHLMQHEAEHRGEIAVLRETWEQEAPSF